MKSILRKILILSLAVFMALFCLTACDTGELPGEEPGGEEPGGEEPGTEQVVIYSLVLEASKTSAKRGDKITFSSALKAEGKEDIPSEDAVYEIVSGKDYATILNNELTILNTAPHGAEIKVRAKEGATYSNEITVSVNVAPTSITISAGGITNVTKGQSVILNTTIAPTGANSNIVWNILEGSQHAAISSNILVVNSTAKTGDKIKVQASIGEVKSNELTFDIGYTLNSVAITPTGDLNILPGKSAQVTVLFDPTNATDKDFELVITKACEGVTVQGNVITVASTAKIGDTFKVKAVSGTKESNELEYTVGYPLANLEISASGVTNIPLNGEATVIVTVTPSNATNGAYELKITNGYTNATISGNKVVLGENAKTGDIIKVKAVALDGTKESAEISFTVGYPVTDLTIKNDVTNILLNGEATPTVSYLPLNATNGEYTLVITNDYANATVVGNKIVLTADAKTGDIITVKAVLLDGTVESTAISYTVGYPLESLSISQGNVTNIKAGEEADAIVTYYPTNSTNADYTLFISNGYEHAEIVGNTIKVKSTATTGDIIKVKVKNLDGSIVSEKEITYIVGYPLVSLTAKVDGANSISLLPGVSAELTVSLNPANATNGEYEWVFTDETQKDLVTITNNVITVKDGTALGTVIKFKAVAIADETIFSEEITIVVNTAITSITISSEANGILDRNQSYTVSIDELLPTDASAEAITWVVTEGADYAYIRDGKLHIGNNFPAGTLVSFKAVSGSISSNTLSYTVGVKLDSIEIAIDGEKEALSIEPGDQATISLTKDPANATDNEVIWVIDEGNGYATIQNGVITVANNKANVGKTVKFHAEIAGVKSNYITVTIGVELKGISINVGSKTELSIEPGDSKPISAIFTPTDATIQTIENWVIEEGGDFATISNGIITILDNKANIGKTVKFHAVIGGVKSNTVTVTIGVVLNKIDIAIGSKTEVNIEPGDEKNITATLTPTHATLKDIEQWVIESGSEYATVANGIVSIKADADVGAEVKFHAIIGGVKSNTITVTVGTPITSIVISTPGDKTEIVKGNSAELEIVLTPSNASTKLIKWEIAEGAAYATISQNNNMTVSSDAPTGTTIKVRAYFKNVYSNELTFTVMPTQEEINAEKFYLYLSNSEVTVDKKGSSSPKVTCTVYDGNLKPVTNKELTVAINGEQYLGVNANGYELTFSALGHGEATVTVTIEGTAESKTFTVNVIVPPEAVDLPEVFKERVDIVYDFSMKQPGSTVYETLPFAPFIRGDALACQDYEVTFRHASGEEGDTVATYDYNSKTITFKKTGKITVMVSSKSGSYVNPVNSYVFNINNGYNAHTFNELQGIIESSSYNGQIINLVVTEKPVGETEYKYGYDIVPPTALKLKENQTISDLLYGPLNASGGRSGLTNNRIQAVNKSLYINGNNHKIDASQMRTFTQKEYNDHLNSTEKIGNPHFNLSALLSAEPWHSSEADTEGVTKDKYWTVNLYNLEVIGNCSIDYGNQVGNSVYGSYSEGISIGKKGYTTDYFITADNLTMTNFVNGLHLAGAVGNSKISNITAGNCYQNGIMIQSCLITLENMTFGPCGAGAIEVSPDEASTAGIDDNELTNVTFAGTIDAMDCINDGNTTYFNKYTAFPIPTIITGNVNSLSDNQKAHIMADCDADGDNDFIFVMLKFDDLSGMSVGIIKENPSQINYAAYQAGGIINVTDIGNTTVDTTHQYIMMDIYYGSSKVGTAIFYNMNYVAPAN